MAAALARERVGGLCCAGYAAMNGTSRLLPLLRHPSHSRASALARHVTRSPAAVTLRRLGAGRSRRHWVTVSHEVAQQGSPEVKTTLWRFDSLDRRSAWLARAWCEFEAPTLRRMSP